jgi:hypothetical protein
MLGLPDEAWPDKEIREHCLGVFGYARVVLKASDGDLLSDQAFSGIRHALSAFESDPAAAANNADPYSSDLIDAVARLPAARVADRAAQ